MTCYMAGNLLLRGENIMAVLARKGAPTTNKTTETDVFELCHKETEVFARMLLMRTQIALAYTGSA